MAVADIRIGVVCLRLFLFYIIIYVSAQDFSPAFAELCSMRSAFFLLKNVFDSFKIYLSQLQ